MAKICPVCNKPIKLGDKKVAVNDYQSTIHQEHVKNFLGDVYDLLELNVDTIKIYNASEKYYFLENGKINAYEDYVTAKYNYDLYLQNKKIYVPTFAEDVQKYHESKMKVDILKEVEYEYQIMNTYSKSDRKKFKVEFAFDKSTGDFCITPILNSYVGIININDVEDVTITTNGSTESALGGILAGGMIGGVAGAIIGSSSGGEYCNNLSIEFYTNNVDNPRITYNFVTNAKLYKSGDEYIKLSNFINEIVQTVKSNIVARKANDNKFGKQTIAESDDIVEKLERLAKLKTSGILTNDEFLKTKNKILNA